MTKRKTKDVQKVSRRDFRKDYIHAMQVVEKFPLISPVDVYEGLDKHNYLDRHISIGNNRAIFDERLHLDDIGFFQRFDLEDMTKHFRISPNAYDPETAVDGVGHIREYFKSQWGRKASLKTNFLLVDFYSYFVNAKTKLNELFSETEGKTVSSAFLEMNGIVLPLEYRSKGHISVESAHSVLDSIIEDIEESARLPRKGKMGIVNSRTKAQSVLEEVIDYSTEEYLSTSQTKRFLYPYVKPHELSKLRKEGEIKTRKEGRNIYYSIADLKFLINQRRVQEDDVNKKAIIQALEKSIPPKKLKLWKSQKIVDYEDLMNLSNFKHADEEAIIDTAEKLELLGIRIKEVTPDDTQYKKHQTRELNDKMHKDNVLYYMQTVLPNKILSDEEEEEVVKKHIKHRDEFSRLAIRNPSIAYKIAREMNDFIYSHEYSSSKALFDGDDDQIGEMILDWKRNFGILKKNLNESKNLEKRLIDSMESPNPRPIEQKELLSRYKDIQDMNERILLESGLKSWTLASFARNFLDEEEIIPELTRTADARKSYSKYKEVRDTLTNSLVRLGFTLANRRSKHVSRYQQNIVRICDYQDVMLDLTQEANVGILKAIDRFDPEIAEKKRSKKLSTYATYWIKQRMGRRLDELRELKPHQAEEYFKMDSARKEFVELRHREPSVFELADLMNTTPKKVIQIRNHKKNIDSLDRVIDDASGTPLSRMFESSPKKQKKSFTMDKRAFLDAVADIVDEREWYVLDSRYMKRMTLEEVGETLDVTRERVRQIESGALRKLQVPANKRILSKFVHFDRKSKEVL